MSSSDQDSEEFCISLPDNNNPIYKTVANNAWILSQQQAHSDNTDESDVDDIEESVDSQRQAIDLSYWTESFSTNERHYNNKGPMTLKVNEGSKSEESCYSDDETTSQHTCHDLLEVSAPEYDIICNDAKVYDGNETVLTPYESRVASKTFSVEDLEQDEKRLKMKSTGSDEVTIDSLTKNSTTDSGKESPEYLEVTQEQLSHRKYSLQEALENIQINDDQESMKTDEGALSVANDNSDDSSTDEETAYSDVAVNMKEYYKIRHETTSCRKGQNEFVLEMNPVQSIIQASSIDYKSDASHSDGEYDSIEESGSCQKIVANEVKTDKEGQILEEVSNKSTSEEDISGCGETFKQDEIEKAKLKLTSHSTIVNQSQYVAESEAAKADDNTDVSAISIDDQEASFSTGIEAINLSLSSGTSSHHRKTDITNHIFRIQERNNLVGTIAIICSSQKAHIQDDVHGVRFLEIDDDHTEEYSNISDAFDDELRESTLDTPATEDEVVSDFEFDECDNPHPKIQIEHELPSNAKKIISYVEGKDGSIKQNIVESLDPDQMLSLNDFVKETDKTESLLLPQSDDEVEELPKDSPMKTKRPYQKALQSSQVMGKPHTTQGTNKGRRRKRRKSSKGKAMNTIN